MVVGHYIHSNKSQRFFEREAFDGAMEYELYPHGDFDSAAKISKLTEIVILG